MFDFPEHNNNYVFSKSDEYTFFIYCNKGITRCGTYEELHKSWPYNEYTDKTPVNCCNWRKKKSKLYRKSPFV